MPWGGKGSQEWVAKATLSYAELCSCRARRVPYSPSACRKGATLLRWKATHLPCQQPPGMENKPQVIATALGQLLDLRRTLG